MDYFQHKEIVDSLIKEYIQNNKHDTRIRSGMQYVLDNGKRLRPSITLAILEKLLPDTWKEFKDICLVPEFIHSSSLIIDDLPSFDNAQTRRGKQCIHLYKGEGLAYLLAVNLVVEAMLLVQKQLPKLKQRNAVDIAYKQYEEQLTNIINNISGHRAIGGQLLSTFHTSGDINVREMDRSLKLKKEEIYDILNKKTSSFFEIAMVLAWITGSGDINKIKDVQKASNILGLCYQIYDDFCDYEEDVENSDHFSHNYVYHRGIKVAYQEFLEYIEELKVLINELSINCPMFDYLIEYMSSKILLKIPELENKWT